MSSVNTGSLMSANTGSLTSSSKHRKSDVLRKHKKSDVLCKHKKSAILCKHRNSDLQSRSKINQQTNNTWSNALVFSFISQGKLRLDPHGTSSNGTHNNIKTAGKRESSVLPETDTAPWRQIPSSLASLALPGTVHWLGGKPDPVRPAKQQQQVIYIHKKENLKQKTTITARKLLHVIVDIHWCVHWCIFIIMPLHPPPPKKPSPHQRHSSKF